MALVILFLLFNCALIVASFRRHWMPDRTADAAPPPKRMTPEMVKSFALRQLFLVVILAVTWMQGAWDIHTVGIGIPAELWMLWLPLIVIGELGFLALVVVYALLLRLFGRLETVRHAAVRGNMRVWPRKRSHKIVAAIAIMLFNPFTEELVMRGILVYHWGLVLGSPVIPVIVGFVLNALLHWYQGWRMQLWHALFYCLAVYLLYEWSLIACITAHVLGDVLPFITLRREQRRVRAARRRLQLAKRTA
jgi:hypothetical protein